MPQQPIFIVSDGSGVTAETICHTLLSQFPTVNFNQESLPFVDSLDKVEAAVGEINRAAASSGLAPLVFTTFVEEEYAVVLSRANARIFDLFDPFIGRMEESLGQKSSHQPGQAHGIANILQYNRRMSAVNYAMHCDDGLHTQEYGSADVILLGVSRSGKTPTCLYLALHFGFHVANYPLTQDDFVHGRLPESILVHRDKAFGLNIDASRLHQIRQERRPGSEYASLKQCREDVELARNLFERYRIQHCDSTSYSIEELGSTIKHQMGLHSELY